MNSIPQITRSQSIRLKAKIFAIYTVTILAVAIIGSALLFLWCSGAITVWALFGFKSFLAYIVITTCALGLTLIISW